MTVKNEINGETYKKLISYVLKKCDAVMMIFRKDGMNNFEINSLNQTIKMVHSNLLDEFLSKRNGAHWIFTKIGYTQLGVQDYSDPPGFDDLFEVRYYKLTSNTQKYLLTNDSMYNWLNPKYPEDISFFKNGYCWLYSVSHEHICDIYCEDEEEYEYLKSIGVEFVDDCYTPVQKEELYYEDF